MTLTSAEDFVGALGNPTHKIRLCWTVNLSPNTSIKFKEKKRKWGELRPSEQYVYFRDTYLPGVVRRCVDAYKFTFELTSKGELHMHGLCLIYANPQSAQYWLTDVRKGAAQLLKQLTRSNCRFGNHICLNDRLVEWALYLDKDKGKLPFRPLYFVIPRDMSTSPCD